MNLTKDFIELQGFRFETTTPEGLQIFTIRNEDRIYDLMVNTEDETLTLDKYENHEDDPECIYDGKILNIIQFCSLLQQNEDITDKRISLPNNFVEDFMKGDYNYSQNDFEGMCDLALLMLLAKEEYEKCNPFLEFRKHYYSKKEWTYKDMDENKFKDYSKITERTLH
jgi:hypothetical protein